MRILEDVICKCFKYLGFWKCILNYKKCLLLYTVLGGENEKATPFTWLLNRESSFFLTPFPSYCSYFFFYWISKIKIFKNLFAHVSGDSWGQMGAKWSAPGFLCIYFHLCLLLLLLLRPAWQFRLWVTRLAGVRIYLALTQRGRKVQGIHPQGPHSS